MTKHFLSISDNLTMEYSELVIAPNAEYEINPKKAELIKYLHSHENDGVVAGKIYDSVKDAYVDMYEKSYNDGVYAWWESDIYYFNNYNIKLKPEFVSHALR